MALLGVLAIAATGYTVYAENSNRAQSTSWYAAAPAAPAVGTPAPAMSDANAAESAKLARSRLHIHSTQRLVACCRRLSPALPHRKRCWTSMNQAALTIARMIRRPKGLSTFGNMFKDPAISSVL